jgi:hypothetical protein
MPPSQNADAPAKLSDDTISSFMSLDEGAQRAALGKLSAPAKQALLIGIKSRASTPAPAAAPVAKTPDTPDAPSRFAGSFTESFGLPADIRQWPKVATDLAKGPIPTKLGPQAEAANAAINIGKGVLTASSDAAQTGLDRMKKPGWQNKLVGGMQYIESGIPVLGPSLVKAGDQFEKEDYAGGFGTVTGTAMQILSGSPEVREKVASVPGKVAAGAKSITREAVGIGDKPVAQAHAAWAKDMLKAQSEHEAKILDTIAEHKDDTAKAQADLAKKVAEQNEKHAKRIADINADHAEKVAKVRGENAQAKGEFEAGQQAKQAAERHAKTISDVLPQVERSATAEARNAYPQIDGTVPPEELYKSLKDAKGELRGTENLPGSLNRIISDVTPKTDGLTVMGQQLDPANPAHAGMIDKLKEQGITPKPPEPLTFDKLHGYYSELGRDLYDRDLPGDEKKALFKAREVIADHMRELAEAEGKQGQFEDAQEKWKTVENTFRNSRATASGGSPVARALKTRDPITGKLRPDYVQQIMADPKASKIAEEHLGRFTDHGAPVQSLRGLRSATEAGKAAPKTLKVAPEPSAPKLPEKPAPPEGKFPPPPEFPDRPQVEPFSAQAHRMKLLKEISNKLERYSRSPWIIGAKLTGLIELLTGNLPYAWSLPASRAILQRMLDNAKLSGWISKDAVGGIGGGSASRVPAVSPLTQRRNSIPPPPEQ